MDQRSPLLNQGLTLALQGLVDEMQKLAGPSTVITLEIAGRTKLELTDEQATSIYRIAQEALNNALKHARASKIQVKLEIGAGRALRLVVSDNGIGIGRANQEGTPDQGHFGLILMQERATMIHADSRIRSPSEGGTRVVLEVHL